MTQPQFSAPRNLSGTDKQYSGTLGVEPRPRSAGHATGHANGKSATPCLGDFIDRFGDFRALDGLDAECNACSSRSLHVLYTGYSYHEWICDICGARTDTPVTFD